MKKNQPQLHETLEGLLSHDLLTADEERLLLEQSRDGPSEEERKKARDKLILMNVRLVVDIAQRYSGFAELEDLISDGLGGLIRAIDLYDLRRENRLSTFATRLIKQSIWRSPSLSGTIQISRPATEKLLRVKKRLEAEHGRTPTFDKLGIHLKETRQKILLKALHGRQTLSLSVPVNNDRGGREKILGHFVVNPDAEMPDQRISREDDLAKLRKVLDSGLLNEQERAVITEHFGLDKSLDPKNQTLDAVGKRRGLTRERVRQIEEKALGKLKEEFGIRKDRKQKKRKRWKRALSSRLPNRPT